MSESGREMPRLSDVVDRFKWFEGARDEIEVVEMRERIVDKGKSVCEGPCT